MSFGKRGTTDPATGAPRPRPQMVADATATTSDNGGFIALVAAVVLIAGALAFIAPSAMSWLSSAFSGGGAVRPLPQIVENLSRPEAKQALASQALPDKHGRAFLATLRDAYNTEHDRLLERFTTIATTGGDRDEAVLALNEWSAEFFITRLPDIARTGAEGYDALLDTFDATFAVMRAMDGDICQLPQLAQLAKNPDQLMGIGAYGSAGYELNMKASARLVELAAKGSRLPRPDAQLTPEDEAALQQALMAFVREPWVMKLQMQIMASGSAIPDANNLPNINICTIGKSAVKRFRNIPDGTKARLMGMVGEGMGPVWSSQMQQFRLSQR